MGKRRTAALALIGVTAANVLALGALVASLLSGDENGGGGVATEGREDLELRPCCW